MKSKHLGSEFVPCADCGIPLEHTGCHDPEAAGSHPGLCCDCFDERWGMPDWQRLNPRPDGHEPLFESDCPNCGEYTPTLTTAWMFYAVFECRKCEAGWIEPGGKVVAR